MKQLNKHNYYKHVQRVFRYKDNYNILDCDEIIRRHINNINNINM